LNNKDNKILKVICKSISKVDKYMISNNNLPFPEKLKDAFNITVKVPEIRINNILLN